MPMIRVETSARLPADKQGDLMRDLSKILAAVTRKPEGYCMVLITQASASSMGGKEMPVAFVDVKGIGGLSKQVNAELSRQVADKLCEELGLSEDAIYLTFTEVAATNWGWKGQTFA